MFNRNGLAYSIDRWKLDVENLIFWLWKIVKKFDGHTSAKWKANCMLSCSLSFFIFDTFSLSLSFFFYNWIFLSLILSIHLSLSFFLYIWLAFFLYIFCTFFHSINLTLSRSLFLNTCIILSFSLSFSICISFIQFVYLFLLYYLCVFLFLSFLLVSFSHFCLSKLSSEFPVSFLSTEDQIPLNSLFICLSNFYYLMLIIFYFQFSFVWFLSLSTFCVWFPTSRKC